MTSTELNCLTGLCGLPTIRSFCSEINTEYIDNVLKHPALSISDLKLDQSYASQFREKQCIVTGHQSV